MDVHDVDAEKQCYAVIPARKSRNDRISRLVVVCVIQSLLTALCLAISIYNLGTVQHGWKSDRGKNIGIYLEVLGDVIRQKEKLEFEVRDNHKTDLAAKTTLSFQCSGPYILIMSACSTDMESQKSNGSLILQQRGVDRITIPLYSQDNCKDSNSPDSQRDQRMLFFSKYHNVSVRFTSESLRLGHLRMSFNYLLGEQCFGDDT